MFNPFKSTEPYTQAEIAEQVRIIGELQNQSRGERTAEAIAAAQEVLLFMQDENKDYYDKIRNSKPHR